MSKINHLEKHGKDLIDRGFNIVPISPGTKFPKLKGWQHLEATPALVDQWVAEGFTGVGVLTKFFPAVDIDVLDKVVCDQMVEIVKEIVGPSMQRIGKAPKVLLPYRTETPFKKVTSKVFVNGKVDLTHKVEILSDGQQYVAFADHPDTGKPYTWSREGDGLEYHASKLPLITEEQAKEIVHRFQEIAQSKEGWKAKEEGTTQSAEKEYTSIRGDFTSKEQEEFFLNNKPRLVISVEQIKSTLKELSAEDYDDWRTVGMGLWHQFNGGEEGFEIWNEWSMNSSKYYHEEMRSKWDSFNHKGSTNPVTFASAIKMAQNARLERDPLSEFLCRYVYIASEDAVHDLQGGAQDENIPLSNFKNDTSNIRMNIDTPLKTDPERKKNVPVSAQWMIHPDRKRADGLTYDPEGGRSVESGTRTYINQFQMAEIPPPIAPWKEWRALIKPFNDHMKYLFPNKDERLWFINWMALNIQHPDRRCKVVPLHVSIHHGTGRGWLVKLMERLLGEWNCERPKMPDLVDGQFREYLDKTLFCAVEEVREASINKPYAVSDSVRDILIEDRISVNLKYGKKGTKRIYTNFFLMSNHPDALVLKEVDRRINVFQCNEKPKSQDYYNRLYGWVKDKKGSWEPSEGVCALYHSLKEKKLDGFNWQRSFDNEARQNMIEENQSPVEQACRIFLQNPPYFAMTLNKIAEKVSKIMDEDSPNRGYESPSKMEKQIGKILTHEGFKRSRIRVPNRKIPPRYWIIKRGKYTDQQIKNELVKQDG